jgi:hypothetical protein
MALHRTFYLTYILIYWWSSGRGERISQCPVGKMCSWWSLSFVSLWFQCLYWKVSWSWRYWCHWMQWRTEEQPWIFWIGWPWLTGQTGHMNVRWIRVQLDFLLADLRLQFVQTRNVFMIAIGLDHRCVHAVVHVAVRHPKVISYRRRHLKHWKPFMNARNEAHGFQTSLQNTTNICWASSKVIVRFIAAGLVSCAWWQLNWSN